VILVDANLLIYAHVVAFAQHEPARCWLDKQFNETARVGLPWPSLLAFVRVVTPGYGPSTSTNGAQTLGSRSGSFLSLMNESCVSRNATARSLGFGPFSQVR
jgi:hypothetical protein